MKKTVLSVVFYLMLAILILFVLLIGRAAESGKLSQNTIEPGSNMSQNTIEPGSNQVKPVSPYEEVRRIVGLAVSRCWTDLGENPTTDPNLGDAKRREVTTKQYLDCIIKNLGAWKLESNAIE